MDLTKYYPDIAAKYPAYVTQRELCEICRICPKTAYNLEQQGEIPYTIEQNHLIRSHKIKLTDILAYLYRRECRQEADSPYICATKPFSMPILIRKIAAVLRRSSQGTVESYQSITYGNLLLNCDGYTATMNGNTFELTQKEFEILRELLTHQGRILTRQNLLDKLWRYDFYGDERVVDTHIKNLRKKLGIGFIQTIRGVGYKIDKEN